MKWYLEAFQNKYAQFSGRAHMEEFWMFTLFNVLATIGIAILAYVVHFHLLSSLYALAVVTPHLAIGSRRLHDTNRSAWWLLLALIPILGALVLIFFFVTESDHGENQYGPNPRAAA